jgi:hypothetical protein
VIRAARRPVGDIPAAARALGIALTHHVTVLARAKHAVAKIEAGMAWAERNGVLHEFNQEYRRRRLEAARQGRRFMGLCAGDGEARHKSKTFRGHRTSATGEANSRRSSSIEYYGRAPLPTVAGGGGSNIVNEPAGI